MTYLCQTQVTKHYFSFVETHSNAFLHLIPLLGRKHVAIIFRRDAINGVSTLLTAQLHSKSENSKN